MVSTTNKTKLKRSSKSQRTHVRRMKQAARKDGTAYDSHKVRHTPAKIAGE
jgi:hypothetical protein